MLAVHPHIKVGKERTRELDTASTNVVSMVTRLIASFGCDAWRQSRSQAVHTPSTPAEC